jgi:thiamine-monophosphate kinase
VRLDELSIIDRYFRPLAGEGAFALRDDAGRIVVPDGQELVVTTDMIASRVHFLPGDPPDTIARKALRVNLSDLAGKGAQPLAYLVSLGLASTTDEEWLGRFAEGLRKDQGTFGIGLLGGDTIDVADGPVISITAFGVVAAGRMVHRFGGRPSDALYVSGTIGAGAIGLALLKGEKTWEGLSADLRAKMIQRFRVPEPRLQLAPALVEHASAAMDISDGLVGDCDKLARASGCSAEINAERVPLPAGIIGGPANPSMLARLITAGDDYEILAAIPPDQESAFRKAAESAGVPVMRVGELTAGSGPTRVLLNGDEMQLEKRSWVHGPGET